MTDYKFSVGEVALTWVRNKPCVGPPTVEVIVRKCVDPSHLTNKLTRFYLIEVPGLPSSGRKGLWLFREYELRKKHGEDDLSDTQNANKKVSWGDQNPEVRDLWVKQKQKQKEKEFIQ